MNHIKQYFIYVMIALVITLATTISHAHNEVPDECRHIVGGSDLWTEIMIPATEDLKFYESIKKLGNEIEILNASSASIPKKLLQGTLQSTQRALLPFGMVEKTKRTLVVNRLRLTMKIFSLDYYTMKTQAKHEQAFFYSGLLSTIIEELFDVGKVQLKEIYSRSSNDDHKRIKEFAAYLALINSALDALAIRPMSTADRESATLKVAALYKMVVKLFWTKLPDAPAVTAAIKGSAFYPAALETAVYGRILKLSQKYRPLFNVVSDRVGFAADYRREFATTAKHELLTLLPEITGRPLTPVQINLSREELIEMVVQAQLQFIDYFTDLERR